MKNRSFKFFIATAMAAVAVIGVLKGFSNFTFGTSRQIPGLSDSNNGKDIISKTNDELGPASKTSFAGIPLHFEINRGQTDSSVKFFARGDGYGLFLTEEEAVFTLSQNHHKTGSKPEERALADRDGQDLLRMKLRDSNSSPKIEGEDELAGKSNYIKSGSPDQWLVDIPTYSAVRYREVYPGIDQIFYGNQKQLEYDFIVAPHADAGQIAINFEGAKSLEIAPSTGELVLDLSGETIAQQKPLIYQNIDGEKRYVAGNYILKDEKTVGFELGEYDRSQPLIIDPVLVYSTYLGGSSQDWGQGVAVDAEGNAYVTGGTQSPDFPLVNSLQNRAGQNDVFVTKINPQGNAIVYSTYIGGENGEHGLGIDVDANGNAYVTGAVVFGGFPVTQGSFDNTFNGTDDAFLFKLNPSGNALVYSTYFGGANTDLGTEVKVNRSTGEAFVGGTSLSGTGFPTTPGAFNRTGPESLGMVFVTKFNAQGSDLIYSTFIGGGSGNDLAIDADGNAYVTGSTLGGFPVTPGAAQTACDGCNLLRSNAFIAKLNSGGSGLIYSTLLGGSQEDGGNGIIADAQGNAYVTGETESSAASLRPFPTTPGAYITSTQGRDAFVVKVNPTGTAFVYSTLLGGSGLGQGLGIAVDNAGRATAVGKISSFMQLVNPVSTVGGGFVATLNPSGSALVFSSRIGFEASEIVTDSSTSNIYITGEATSNLTTVNPIQANLRGATDAFLAKIQLQPPPRSVNADFDRDGKADISVWRESGGVWFVNTSGTSPYEPIQFGQPGDQIVPGDFDGDGKADLAVYRAEGGMWYLQQSSAGPMIKQWGLSTDVAVSGDFDGDGKADIAVWRPSTGVWFVRNSGNGQTVAVQYGQDGDKLVPGDYDGDGKTDLAVWRQASGIWFIRKSSGGETAVQFGQPTDKVVPADYDGDGKTDLAVYREGNLSLWYIFPSTASAYTVTQWGTTDDVPVPGDYDGDGKTDISVWRPSNGIWFMQRSTSGFLAAQFGQIGDKPVPAAYLPVQ